MSDERQIQTRLKRLTPERRNRMRRELIGEADRDRIVRGQVYVAIRELRTSPVSLASSDYQRALRDVQIAVSNLDGDPA